MNAEHMARYYEVYNSEDAGALARFYHPQVELVSAQGTLAGVQAVLDTYQQIIAGFADQMTPTRIDVSGARAVVDITDRFTARHDVEDFLGMSLKQGESFELRLRGTYDWDEEGRFVRIVIEQLV